MSRATAIQPDAAFALPAAARVFERLKREESGQDLIEYALILCFLALGTVASMKAIGTAIAALVTSIGSTLTSAT